MCWSGLVPSSSCRRRIELPQTHYCWVNEEKGNFTSDHSHCSLLHDKRLNALVWSMMGAFCTWSLRWSPPYWGEQDIWCEWSVLHFGNSLIVNPSLFSHGVGKQLSCHISDLIMLNWREGSHQTAESIGCGELGSTRAVTGESGWLPSIASHGSTTLYRTFMVVMQQVLGS